jgi:aspartate kinase
MIVAKFGGTSVGDAAAIRRLVGIVATRRAEGVVVVVSALARVTDALLALETHHGGAVREHVAAITARHRAVAADLGLAENALTSIEADAAGLAAELAARPESRWSPAERDAVASRGELWSSRLVTATLIAGGVPATWVDAREVIATDDRFTEATPRTDEIEARANQIIRPIVARGDVPVTQGFIGRAPDGRTTTLGRGGSDYTASLLGRALNVERVEIWTDVDGLLSADPRIIPNARLLPEASYHEAAELAAFGAKVLHPATQRPLAEAGIPCWVKNSFAPDRSGTKIVAGARPGAVGASPVRAIACKKGITVINLRAPHRLGAVEFLGSLFGIFARHQVAVDVLASSEVNVSVTVEASGRLEGLLTDLGRIGTVTTYPQRAIVAVVGIDLRGSRGLSGRLFGAIRDVNVEVISQGASEINVTFVVREEDGDIAVRALHREFLE